MAYYITIKENKIVSIGQCPCSNEDALNYEVSEELYNAFNTDPDRYIWNGTEIVENPDYEEIKLEKAKAAKYEEANTGAKEFIANGNALFEFDEGKHVEATDGNIGKFTAYALAYVTGKLQPEDTVVWNTKEDENVELDQEAVVTILDGMGQAQATVWAVKYATYAAAIKAAETVEEVEAIEIDYTIDPSEMEAEE
jgi:hypothetical protein